MAIKKTDGKTLLKENIKKDLRHEDYERVTSIQKKYSAYAIADEDDTRFLLRQFVPNETNELFEQRIKLTSLTTPDLINCLITPMYKVGRTTATEIISWGDDKEESKKKLKELNQVANKYYGDMSVKNYLSTRLVQLDALDCNSFIVTEFSGIVDPNRTKEKARPYPFEVSSHEAINFQYINNELQWLIVMIGDGKKYTIYLENDSIAATLITKEQLKNILTTNPRAEIFYKDEDNKDNSPMYLIEEFNHKAGIVPARRVGTNRDPKTRFRTCVPMIHPAQCYFEKAIKTVSEFDITNALHVFPKVFRYDSMCPGNMANGTVCSEGKTQDGSKCKECGGTGWKSQTSTAHEYIVKLPKDPKDMVSLENMMATKAPPAHILEFQKNFGLYELREAGIKAVYNSDTYVSDTIASTATEKNIDLDAVYDALKPFADNWSEMWKHVMFVIAAYRDLSKEISIAHSFPKDFKMKSINTLLDELKKANDSGAPSYVKKAIQRDIAHKIYIDHPGELIKIQVKELFFPFNGKSESEIMNILSSGLKSKFDQVLYANYDQLFDEIEQEMTETGVNFYEMDYTAQKKLIKTKVDEYIDIIEKEESNTRSIAFGTVPSDDGSEPAVAVGGGITV